jgi:uncharacterized protein DUF4232
MDLRWRRCAAALAGALVLAACTSGAPPSPASTGGPSGRPSTTAVTTIPQPTPADPSAPCAAENVRASLIGAGPAVGRAALIVRLVNRGRWTCREHGWPRVVARSARPPVTAGHTRTDRLLAAGTLPRLPTISLAPGAAAYLVVSGSAVALDPSGTEDTCPPAFHTLRITLPHDNRVLVVRPGLEPSFTATGGFPACGDLTVTPVVPADAVWVKLRDLPAHRPLPRCHAGQVHVRYRAGAFRAGVDFGYLRLVNDSSGTCQLSGSVQVRPVDRHGKVIRFRGAPNDTVRLRSVQVLAHTGSRRTVAILVGASVRTADGREACPIKQRVSPAAWRLTGAINATVANTDPAVQPYERGRVRHLYGCSGPSGIALADAALGSK